MSERQADPRCRCGAPHSAPLHVLDHQFVMANTAEEALMSETATTLNLRERACVEAEENAKAARERAARDHAEYIDRARRAGVSAFKRLLGTDTAPDQWTPEGDGTDSDRYRSATAEIDGLRFRAVERYSYEVGHSYHLYLLVRCDNPMHLPHDKQTEIGSLAALHYALQEDSEEGWYCFACERDAEEERYEERAAEAPARLEPTPLERLCEALRQVIRDEVGAARASGEF